MRVTHNISTHFDDPKLIGAAGLRPLVALATLSGLPTWRASRWACPSAGANTDFKVTWLVAGMVAGADSIDDMDLVRHSGMGRVFLPGVSQLGRGRRTGRGHPGADHGVSRRGQ